MESGEHSEAQPWSWTRWHTVITLTVMIASTVLQFVVVGRALTILMYVSLPLFGLAAFLFGLGHKVYGNGYGWLAGLIVMWLGILPHRPLLAHAGWVLAFSIVLVVLCRAGCQLRMRGDLGLTR
jgi:hypothetical protein